MCVCMRVCRTQQLQDADMTVGLSSPSTAQVLVFVGPCTSSEKVTLVSHLQAGYLRHITLCVHYAYSLGE